MLGPPQRPGPDPSRAAPLQSLQPLVPQQEQRRPGEDAVRRHRRAQRDVAAVVRKQLVQAGVGRDRHRRSARPDDRQRDHDGPRPGREGVDVEREPAREQHHLGRDGGHAFPLVEAEECQVELEIGLDPMDPAKLLDPGPSPYQRGMVRREAGQLQRPVGLHRGRHVRRPPDIDRPAAIGPLRGQYGASQRRHLRGLSAPQEVQQHDDIALHRDIAPKDLGAPEAVIRVSPAQERTLRPADPGRQAVIQTIRRRGCPGAGGGRSQMLRPVLRLAVAGFTERLDPVGNDAWEHNHPSSRVSPADNQPSVRQLPHQGRAQDVEAGRGVGHSPSGVRGTFFRGAIYRLNTTRVKTSGRIRDSLDPDAGRDAPIGRDAVGDHRSRNSA